MPPKCKFTKEEIIETAFQLVRKDGWSALTARSLAKSLGSSARPIYSYFHSMKDLEKEIVGKGVDLLYQHMTRKRTDDPWQNHGIGYVMFAWEEKCLFRALNDENHIQLYKKYGETIWNTLTNSLSDYEPFQGLSNGQIYQVQLTRWLLAHGLAFQASNPPPDLWDDEKIVHTMWEGSCAVLEGLKRRFRKRLQGTASAALPGI